MGHRHDNGSTAGARVGMLTGDNQATASRIAEQLRTDTVIAEFLPGDKAAKIAEFQGGAAKVAMVGDARALAQADVGIAIGAGTDVAIETADVVLMCSDPLDVAIALPIAAGVFEPVFGLVLGPEIAAMSMSGSSLIVAVKARLLKRLQRPRAPRAEAMASGPTDLPEPVA